MAARKTRVNFTLSPDNVRAAQEICEERGLKLSTFVDRAIAAYVKQLRAPADPSPQSRTIGDLEALTDKRLADWYRRCVKSDRDEATDSRIEELFPGLFVEWFERYTEAKYGESDLKEAVSGWIDSALRQWETGSRPSPEAAPPATSTPKASSSAPQRNVDVPEEVRERLRQFSIPQLVEATGMDRPSVTRFRTGSRTRISQANLYKLLAGLEKLEERERE